MIYLYHKRNAILRRLERVLHTKAGRSIKKRHTRYSIFKLRVAQYIVVLVK